MSKTKIPFRVYLGIPFAIISLYLGIRLTIEQTLWTWDRGLQMVGFSLAHGAGILLFPLLLLGIIWAFIYIIISLIKHSFGGWLGIMVLTLFLVGIGLTSIPYRIWQDMFIDKIRESPYAYQQFESSIDKPQRIKYLLEQGFPIDLKNREGKAPLHLASEGGLQNIVMILIKHGAKLDAVDEKGESARYLAEVNHHDAVVMLLSKLGAKSIKGTESQHLLVEKKKFQEMLRFGLNGMGDNKPSEETLKEMEEDLWQQHLKDKKEQNKVEHFQD